MVEPTNFGLKRKPFGSLPTDESVQHWAGMQETKQRLEDIVVSVRPDDIGEREFVIMYGAFGGGKTHALRFFENEINKNPNKAECHAFFVSKSVTSNKPTFWEVYSNIISEYSDGLLPNLAQRFRQAVDIEVQIAKAKYPDSIDTNAIEQAVVKEIVPQSHRDLAFRLLSRNQGAEDVARWLVSKDVASDDYAATSAMASLIGVMTTPIGDQPAPYKAVYLFLDEMEGIMSAKPADSHAFYNAFRELLNKTATYHFAAILAFTTEAVAILEGEIPEYLLARMTRPLPFLEMKELEPDEFKKFVKEYLDSVRSESVDSANPFYPFTEETIDFFLNRPPMAVPRDILRAMSIVFERATRRGKINPGEVITPGIAQSILDDMGGNLI